MRLFGRSAVVLGVGVLALASASLPVTYAAAKVMPVRNVVIGADIARADIPFFVAMESGFKTEANLQHVKLILDVSNQSSETQASQIQTLLNEHVSALILNPVDASAVVPSILAANRAHVPVVLIATGANGGKVYTEVTSNDYTNGELGAQAIVRFLKQRYGSPRGNVVDCEGIVGTTAAQLRQAGFMAVMRKYPNIHIVATFDGEFAIEPAYVAMKDVLTAHPQIGKTNAIDAVFAADDQSAAGVTKAIRESGRYYSAGSPRHIFITGIDGGPTGVSQMKAGNIDWMIGQRIVAMAEATVKYAIRAVEGQPSPGAVVYWPVTLVTPGNLAKVQIWGKSFK